VKMRIHIFGVVKLFLVLFLFFLGETVIVQQLFETGNI
jgi:hypothetical protein